MAESFTLGQAITRGILRLFQGFMALGLLVGIAALGVILLLANGFSLLLTLTPSLQASRTYPAEALRYE